MTGSHETLHEAEHGLKSERIVDIYASSDSYRTRDSRTAKWLSYLFFPFASAQIVVSLAVGFC